MRLPWIGLCVCFGADRQQELGNYFYCMCESLKGVCIGAVPPLKGVGGECVVTLVNCLVVFLCVCVHEEGDLSGGKNFSLQHQ